MANFITPFAKTGPRRNPDANERANGFPCGPADQTLFNGLFHRIEAELGHLISYAGLTGVDTDFTQVRQSIQALINAATGGGETSDYLLLSQASARLPIYPEFQTSDGTINVTSPANGTVRIPGDVEFVHRGVSLISTTQTDFPTAASKTYHLRWNPAEGFVLKDLFDLEYNPDGVPETDKRFDSSYDDMLVSRVITNSSNVSTITNLVNKHSLCDLGLSSKLVTRTSSTEGGGNFTVPFDNLPLSWARTPKVTASASRDGYSSALSTIPEEPTVILNGSSSDNTGTENAVTNRYGIKAVGEIDLNSPNVTVSLGFQLSYAAIAA